jgi:hypothetical protein
LGVNQSNLRNIAEEAIISVQLRVRLFHNLARHLFAIYSPSRKIISTP